MTDAHTDMTVQWKNEIQRCHDEGEPYPSLVTFKHSCGVDHKHDEEQYAVRFQDTDINPHVRDTDHVRPTTTDPSSACSEWSFQEAAHLDAGTLPLWQSRAWTEAEWGEWYNGGWKAGL